MYFILGLLTLSDRYELKKIDNILAVVDLSNQQQSPISIDLLELYDKITKSKFSVKNDPLARAIGVDKKKNLRVIDGTLGFAVDAVKLLYWGCRVSGFEKQPMLAALLKDAYERALNQSQSAWLNQFKITAGDVKSVDFKSVDFDVLYLDPMFFDEDKKSKSKKNIQWLREVVGADEAYDRLIQIVMRERPEVRVVVKRNIKAQALYLPKSGEIKGKLVRYDIYRGK